MKIDTAMKRIEISSTEEEELEGKLKRRVLKNKVRKEIVFSLPLKYKRYLKQRRVHQNLKEEFKNKKEFLSEKANMYKDVHGNYIIKDFGGVKSTKKKFLIVESGKKLNIYKMGISYEKLLEQTGDAILQNHESGGGEKTRKVDVLSKLMELFSEKSNSKPYEWDNQGVKLRRLWERINEQFKKALKIEENIVEIRSEDDVRLNFFFIKGSSRPIEFFSEDFKQEWYKIIEKKSQEKFKIELKKPELPKIDQGELDKINEVYTKPSQYTEAKRLLKENKQLIITGPPHVGKTSTVIHLASSFESGNILKVQDFDDLKGLTECKQNIIILDDIFGDIRLRYDIAYKLNIFLERLKKLKENNNYVTISTRKDIFNELKLQTKLSEDITLLKRVVEISGYGTSQLEKILYNHLEFYEIS